MQIEILTDAVAVGLGATVIMDLWTLCLQRALNIPMPNYCFVGRWLSHMVHGVFEHPSIAAAARKPAECTVGWIAHYGIGVIFAVGFVSFATPRWLESPALLPALVFGIATVCIPFCVMHPAFGLGLASSKTPKPVQARLRSIANHAVFGIGLYVSAIAMDWIAEIYAQGG